MVWAAAGTLGVICPRMGISPAGWIFESFGSRHCHRRCSRCSILSLRSPRPPPPHPQEACFPGRRAGEPDSVVTPGSCGFRATTRCPPHTTRRAPQPAGARTRAPAQVSCFGEQRSFQTGFQDGRKPTTRRHRNKRKSLKCGRQSRLLPAWARGVPGKYASGLGLPGKIHCDLPAQHPPASSHRLGGGRL